jgi:predicted Na+-dependent transporter
VQQILPKVLSASVVVFAVSSMLSVGFAYSYQEIVRPLRNAHAVFRAVIANFVLVPVFVLVVLQFLPLSRSLQIGLLLVATGAGAPFLIKYAQAANLDIALSASLLVLLIITTMVYMPIVLPLILPHAKVSAAAIAHPLFWTMLLPLVVGHFVEVKFADWARRLLPVARKLSTFALIVIWLTTVLLNLNGILNLVGTGAFVGAVVVVGGAFLIGYAMGSSVRRTRGLMGFGTAQRNIAAATVVALKGFDDPDIFIMVVVTSLVSMVLLFPIAAIIRRRGQKNRPVPFTNMREA